MKNGNEKNVLKKNIDKKINGIDKKERYYFTAK